MESFKSAENFNKGSISEAEKKALRQEAERIKAFAEKRVAEQKETENIELVGTDLSELCDADWELYAKFKGWEQVHRRDFDKEFSELQDFRARELYPHLEMVANEDAENLEWEIGGETAKQEIRLPAEKEGRPASGAVKAEDNRQKFYEWITHQWVKDTAALKLAKIKEERRRREREAGKEIAV